VLNGRIIRFGRHIFYNDAVSRRWIVQAIQYVFVTAVVGCIVFVYFKLIHVNPTTVALTFLLGILFVANRLGLRYSVFMSFLAAFAFNFFFLPPTGTFTIADAQNWVALLAFLTAGVLASHLSERITREAQAADRRRREVERLYDFSQTILTSDRLADLLNAIPGNIGSSFHNEAVDIYLLESDRVYRSASDVRKVTKEGLREVADRGEIRCDTAGSVCLAPLMFGLRSVGAIGITGNLPSRETIDALGSLIALAIERSTTAERLARTEAARESERLRSALLDSVTHELRTPLTAITASITSLRSGTIQEPNIKEEMLEVIDEESARLNYLIGQAVEMAQLDSQQVQLQLVPAQMKDAVEGAIEECQGLLENHPTEVRLPVSLPDVYMDINWIRKVLHHLLENAAKYSDAGAPIFISAEVKGSSLITSVADRGSGIDDFEKSLVFDKFYRGQGQRYRVQGTGMGLAIVKAIVEAHNGTVDVTSQPGLGSVFSFSLPLANSV
jgi:two-component system, OmpR family, sensor histidine kinase KdpD